MGASLRVMTYNIRNGRGGDGRVDLGRIAEVVAAYAPDVLALQEVDVGRARSGGVDQAAELARRLGMEQAFASCVEDGDERYGIATLSRWALLASDVLDLPHLGRHRRSEPRRALITRVRWPDSERELEVVNTHLSVLGGERDSQVEALTGALGPGDCVVAGDLNCGRRARPYRSLCARLRPATGRARTWPARLPILQLDHLLYQGALRLVRSGVWTAEPARRASDHLPLVAELARLEVS